VWDHGSWSGGVVVPVQILRKESRMGKRMTRPTTIVLVKVANEAGVIGVL
jgi:hypothetical protein